MRKLLLHWPYCVSSVMVIGLSHLRVSPQQPYYAALATCFQSQDHTCRQCCEGHLAAFSRKRGTLSSTKRKQCISFHEQYNVTYPSRSSKDTLRQHCENETWRALVKFNSDNDGSFSLGGRNRCTSKRFNELIQFEIIFYSNFNFVRERIEAGAILMRSLVQFWYRPRVSAAGDISWLSVDVRNYVRIIWKDYIESWVSWRR
jgi:hypothetical protein